MSQALYRKWRPRIWNEVVGQEHVVHTLQNAIRSDRIGHAYLFAGPRGTGKTTLARMLAKAVNCECVEIEKKPCNECEQCRMVNENRHLDLIEIDAASNTSVDDVRDLREKINFKPSKGKFKVYIIDEVHMLSTAAFNALLKTLEEPPPHAIFILATTEVHKIPATVLSRCQRHEFRRIPVPAIVRYLREMAAQEEVKIDDAALTLIARQATGAMRDGISLLDQLASIGQTIDLELAQTVLGTATNQTVIDLVNAILERDSAAGLNCIHSALDSGTDPRQFARQVVDYLRSLMLVALGNRDQVDATKEMLAQMTQHAQAFPMPHLLETLRLFDRAATDLRTGWQPGLLLELAFAESLEEKQPVMTSPVEATIRPAARVEPSPVQPAQPTVPQQEEPAHRAEPQPLPKREPHALYQEAVTPRQPEPVEPMMEAAPEAPADINVINKNWEQIKQVVKKQRSQTEALLNSCRSKNIRNGMLVLGFASELVKQKMEDIPDNIPLVRAAIRQVTGADIQVSCAVVDPKTNAIPEDLDIDADGMVGAALDLGAKIVKKE